MKQSRFLIYLIVFILLSSCQTIRPEDPLAKGELLIKGVHDPSFPAETLIDNTNIPFLFDNEILSLETQIRALWNTIPRSQLGSPLIGSFTPFSSSDRGYFTDQWEVQTFLDNYATRNTYSLSYSSEKGTFLILLKENKVGEVKLLAWRQIK